MQNLYLFLTDFFINCNSQGSTRRINSDEENVNEFVKVNLKFGREVLIEADSDEENNSNTKPSINIFW